MHTHTLVQKIVYTQTLTDGQAEDGKQFAFHDDFMLHTHMHSG